MPLEIEEIMSSYEYT
jgi:hypothetical protein